MNINKQFIFIIAFLCVLFLNPVQTNVEAAQDSNLKFENITTEKGLSQNYINCIYQDHYGYIWFGTAVGLNKYDGINFTVYYENADEASAISDSWVNSICETGNGQ
jgi:ligand-binding sensor domain-containing protein